MLTRRPDLGRSESMLVLRPRSIHNPGGAGSWAQRGADAGFDEGARVRAIADPIVRESAVAGLEATVTAAARGVLAEGATRDQASWFAITFRCAFDAAMRGRDSFAMNVIVKDPVRH